MAGLADYRPRSWILVEVSPQEALSIPTRARNDIVMLRSDDSSIPFLDRREGFSWEGVLLSDLEQKIMGHNPYPTGPLLTLTDAYEGAQEGALAFASLELMGEEEPRLLLYLEDLQAKRP